MPSSSPGFALRLSFLPGTDIVVYKLLVLFFLFLKLALFTLGSSS
jgi:hypothetical protein